MVGINKRSALAQGLIFCAIPALGYDAVSMTLAERHPYETSKNWSIGVGIKGKFHRVTGQPSIQVYPGARKANFDAGDFTMLSMMDAADNTATAYGGMLSKWDASDDTNPANWCMGANSNGNLVVGAYYAGGDIYWAMNTPQPLGPRSNAQYSVVGRGNAVDLYVDLIKNPITKVRPAYVAGNKSAIRLSCYQEQYPAENFLCNYHLAAVWKRALSVDELAAVYQEPWQLFAHNKLAFGQ